MEIKKVAAYLLLVSSFIFGFQAVKDTDFGWHYRCGEQIIKEGRLCLTNEFSYFLPNYQAAYPSFLYDFVLAFTYDRLDFNGVAALGALLTAFASLLIFQTLKGSTALKLLAIILILKFSGPTLTLGLRSQSVTFLFFALTLYLLEKAKTKPRFLYFLPPLLLLWVNTHIGFISGLILLGAYALEELVNSFSKKVEPSKETSLLVWKGPTFQKIKPSGFAVLSFLATLLNPFGWRVYQEVLNHFFSPLNLMIAEWVAPPPWLQILIIFAAFELIVVLFALPAGRQGRTALSLYSFISLLIFSFLAVKAVRNLPLFYLVFSYWLLPLFDQTQISIPKLTSRLSSKLYSFMALLLLLFFIATTLPHLPSAWKYNTDGKTYCQTGQVPYPCETVKKYPNLSGNLFAMYEWGGFLIWQWPNAKVFADGRMPAWQDAQGNSPYAVLISIVQGQPGWNEFLRQYKTDYILVGAASGLALDIRKNGQQLGWQEVFHGREDAVLFRNTQPY